MQKYMVLIYNDPALLAAMPQEEFNETMRGCLAKADELKTRGALLQSQMLEDVGTARTIRVRNGRKMITDGPFAESKEVLGGFNIIEAESMDEALLIAQSFPWADSGSIEVRPIRDIAAVARRVGAPEGPAKKLQLT
ncbi:MAG TPA: YciI family protein [Gemmatimonadaceae bacterium]|nr:YciI family protein [Gemmatimonadaceae bacterium]